MEQFMRPSWQEAQRRAANRRRERTKARAEAQREAEQIEAGKSPERRHLEALLRLYPPHMRSDPEIAAEIAEAREAALRR